MGRAVLVVGGLLAAVSAQAAESCAGDLVWAECGSACRNVCGTPRGMCASVCVPQCQCPANTFLVTWDGDECVPEADCPAFTATRIDEADEIRYSEGKKGDATRPTPVLYDTGDTKGDATRPTPVLYDTGDTKTKEGARPILYREKPSGTGTDAARPTLSKPTGDKRFGRADNSLRCVAATPRPRRGYFSDASRRRRGKPRG